MRQSDTVSRLGGDEFIILLVDFKPLSYLGDSLSYLKDLPVDELKIDQSFVHDIGSDTDNAAIVQAVIRMGQSLNLRVIAEGVEDQAAVDFLTSNGCEAAQGFYYSEAVALADFERDFLTERA